ncbi:DUF6288 domain-containing protein [Tuwongella immobilis]|uniref:PDZ domain-containing protein n=1 Tax=Tuwongella immobilis TaxID=692036 RepID=A0A6C2YSF4_9BACT|nr:DUF6288 domain-containing protein [Tuwongella immobilis]VIP04610.1 signal peptide protein : Uncharacterized protein OS=Planctomyces limnophilus (strain ATCC 43296 / DSM 3776 / IFAM 1008 / 290) GN=Plim_3151 PE=4 SV=1: HEAT_2: DUF303 [Tuwongella immobilis]VTS06581.1 signal peptide protein : Uncharacterized protein OS=Planctomyces limnophilus (strain ATCC 43296 / DSM 3776 / IFAM 1008 / 290) GN=Plim_3151 PE=4 SV=1: HEAT_2: DUF303 [Tuwongella immobilis]
MTIDSLAYRIVSVFVVAIFASTATAAPNDETPVPDFTNGAKIPKGARHDWNLGPTGLRGWIYCDKLVTTDARQIRITKVEPGSPAAGVFRIGDVILGVGGQPFRYDPRTESGKAITAAESSAGGGKLTMTRWRAGKSEDVTLTLPVLGSYGATAPFECDKSKLLLEQGCKRLAERMSQSDYAEMDAIPRSLNALALLASGNADYLPLVKREAEWVSQFKAQSMQTWYYGYCMLFLSEYVLATGDASVVPGLERLAREAARGQSAVGSWGHGFAIPDGRLGGYGMMNSPGLVLTTGLVLAREAGVKDAAVATAIERSAKLLRFYIGKGAIPYGDHAPWMEGHEDNGKCGMAAVLFHALGDATGAEFFSRMSVAAHGAERDCGHTGNYFNMLWAMPGVALSGANAAGAWMTEFGSWYFDLARRWDGSYPHQGPPENDADSFEGWDATGTYLLAYAMPLQKLRITGRGKRLIPQLDAAAAESLIADGRGWDNKNRFGAYDRMTIEQLIERLGSWSPIVRERAAMALARRKDVPVAAIVKRFDSPTLEARYGACQAVIALGRRCESAVEPLRKCLLQSDLWLRVKAAEALAAIGPAAKPTIPKLLELLVEVDPVNDPRGMQQRYLAFALFDDNGMLRGSLDGVDREALYKAVRAGLKNEDGRARGSFGSVYRNLSDSEIKPLLPAIHRAILEPAPSGEMFADSIRVEGLHLFAKNRIEEGIQACVKYTREQNPWNSQERTPELMKILLSYGTHAKAVIPELTALANYFEKDEPDFPRELMKQKAKSVRDTIRAIQASTETPELIRIQAKPAAKQSSKAPAKRPLKVFILAGQSNMQGHASVTTFESLASDPKTAPLLKQMQDANGKPRVSEKVWITSVGCQGDAYSDLREQTGKLTVGYGAFGVGGNRIGPEYTFGLTLEDQLNEPILLIKTSWGGRSLHTDFRPPSGGPFVLAKETQELWDKYPKGAHGVPKLEDRPKFYAEKAAATGMFYREMIAHVKHVLKDIKRVVPDYDANQGYELAGFVWFQGFNDYVDGGVYPKQNQAGGYDQYADLLAHFIRDVRKDLSAPKLPFVIGVMGIDGRRGDKTPPMMHFRAAQRKPAMLPEFQGNVFVVETAAFWDDELDSFVERRERVFNQLEQEFRKAKPQPKEQQKQAARKIALEKEFKPDELKRLQTGVSNGGYHYLGAAKIMAPIGKAFAEALIEANPVK